MGNKVINVNEEKGNIRVNKILNEFLVSEKSIEEIKKIHTGSEKNIFIKNSITNESESRGFRFINSALKIAENIFTNSIMKNKKINVNSYTTFLYVESEKLFNNTNITFLQDYDQFHFIEKFFHINNFYFDNYENFDIEQKILTFMKNNPISNKICPTYIKKIKNSATDKKLNKIPKREIEFLKVISLKGSSDEIKVNEMTSSLNELKIVETEIEKKNELEYESFVIPSEMFNKSFDEMSLQEYLNMETHRMKLKNFKKDKVNARNPKINAEANNSNYINDKEKSRDDLMIYKGNLMEQDKNKPNFMNIIRNKHLEIHKKKFGCLNQTEKRNKIKITHSKNHKETINMNTVNKESKKVDLIDSQQKILINDSENLNSKRLNLITTRSQSTNLTNNLQRSNTARNRFKVIQTSMNNNNMKSKFQNKLHNFKNSSVKFKPKPIALIKIDIRDLMKEDINFDVNQLISDKYNTFDVALSN